MNTPQKTTEEWREDFVVLVRCHLCGELNEYEAGKLKGFTEQIAELLSLERKRVAEEDMKIIEESQWQCPEHGLPKFEKTACLECKDALSTNVVLQNIISKIREKFLL